MFQVAAPGAAPAQIPRIRGRTKPRDDAAEPGVDLLEGFAERPDGFVFAGHENQARWLRPRGWSKVARREDLT